ncbi:ABC transporter permease [Rhodoluna sp.]|uniref:ABC transporter permease n=1 Tax=Rhodoluna sp. TaxID=1969481 RepID=UPI0025E2541F|nr:ABC transporter permease [Rhodoluna sp.]
MANNTSGGAMDRPANRNEHYVANLADTAMAEIDAVRISEKPTNLYLDAWRDLRKRPMFYIAGVLIIIAAVAALFPGLFTQTAPNDMCLLANSNGAPTDGHPLGFTRQGCDIYSRIVHGTSTSLSVGLIVTVMTMFIGVVFGALAGFYGKWVDALLSRAGDIFFAIPYILAAVVIMSVFSDYRNVWVISMAIGIFAWPSTARVLRGEILRVKQSDYVMASTALGVSRFKILMRHVLPNSIAPVIAVTTISLAAAIVAEATLSFLGVGLPTSTMSWGNDISQAQVDLRTAPQVLIWPSLALSITALAFIMMGEAIRDALDPKARAQR